MNFKKDETYEREEVEEFMRLVDREDDEVTYTSNVGNLYTFIEVDGLLKFVSFQKNRLKIF